MWDIWPRRDLDKLRAFLTTFRHLFPAPGDPSCAVHLAPGEDPVRAQQFMLHDSHRELLLRTTGVQAWHFEQHENEAVFIPSGCAHQARPPPSHRACVQHI